METRRDLVPAQLHSSSLSLDIHNGSTEARHGCYTIHHVVAGRAAHAVGDSGHIFAESKSDQVRESLECPSRPQILCRLSGFWPDTAGPGRSCASAYTTTSKSAQKKISCRESASDCSSSTVPIRYEAAHCPASHSVYIELVLPSSKACHGQSSMLFLCSIGY